MKEINEYKAEQIQGQYIRLNANESNSIFSKGEILDMLLSLQLDNFNRYPDTSTKELRKAYGKFIGYSYKNILAGNGSDQLIGVVISSYINKGDKILTLQPDFSMYDFYVSLNEGQLVKLDIGKKGKFAVKDLIALGKKESPKMIIFSNPNNPTGEVVSIELLEKILNRCREKDVMLVMDECFNDFIEEPERYTMKSYLKDNKNLKDLELLQKQLTSPVLYKQSIKACESEIDAFIEFGSSVLSGLNKKISAKSTYSVFDMASLEATLNALKG